MKSSVALITHNSESYLVPQIDSILLNLGPNDELIVSDDASNDATISIIESYMAQDHRIQLYKNPTALGPNRNCEAAYSHCVGDIIFHSDDDNVWSADKMKIVLDCFRENPKVSMVMHDAKIVDSNLKELHPSFFEWRGSKPGVLHNLIRLTYGGSMIAFRKEMLKRLLPFPNPMPFFFDAWVGFTADKHYKSMFIPDKLSLWRRHEGTTSGDSFQPAGTSKPNKKKKGRLKSRLEILSFIMKH